MADRDAGRLVVQGLAGAVSDGAAIACYAMQTGGQRLLAASHLKARCTACKNWQP